MVPGHGPELTTAEALAVAEADLDFLWRLHDAVAAVLSAAGSLGDAREAGLAVELPRQAPADLADQRVATVEAQLAELVPLGSDRALEE